MTGLLERAKELRGETAVTGAAVVPFLVAEKHLGAQHNQLMHGYRFGRSPSPAHEKRLQKAGLWGDYQRRGGKQPDKMRKPASKPTPSAKPSRAEEKPAEGEKLAKNKYGWASKEQQEFEESSAKLNYERSAVYDKDGKELFRIDGKEKEVTFSDAQLQQMKGAIVTHNHPDFDGKWPDGGSFSFSDIELLANTGASEVRAVTKNYIYVARPKKAGSVNLLGNTAMSFARGEAARLKSAMQAEYQSGRISWGNAQVKYWHDLWTSVASEGWIEYERIPR